MAELSPFRFDPGNQCLWRRSGSEETLIQLTPTEFGVLDHLVAHAGQLVTHRELLDAIWPGVAIEPQVVKNKIFHLRKVLEDDPKQPRYIETLPRRGYRFIGRLERSTPAEEVGEASSARLAGRDGVLAELWQAMGKASSGTVQVVFITGEPGVAMVGAPGKETELRTWATPSLEIEAQDPVAAGVDGEALVFDPPLHFRIRPTALRCRIARHHPGASPAALAPERAWTALRSLVGMAAGRDPRAS